MRKKLHVPDQRAISQRSRKVFAPGKPQQNLKPYNNRAVYLHIFILQPEVLFIQEVSVAYPSLLLDTDQQKMALRAQKVSQAFEKRAPADVRSPNTRDTY